MPPAANTPPSIFKSAPASPRWALPAGLGFEWQASLDSTSSELIRRIKAGHLSPQPLLLATGHQTAGRGRMGRQWLSQEGDCLMLSLAYPAPNGLNLEGLSLALGVGVAEGLNDALGSLNKPLVKLKWPNDLLLAEPSDGALKKLGGVLVESLTSGKTQGNAQNKAQNKETAPLGGESRWLVIGLGINLRLGQQAQQQTPEAIALEPTWSAHNAANAASELSLASLGGLVSTRLCGALLEFFEQGFAAFHARWQALHAYAGQTVRYTSATGEPFQGLALGADTSGALLISTDSKGNCSPLRITSSDGSLRPLKS